LRQNSSVLIKYDNQPNNIPRNNDKKFEKLTKDQIINNINDKGISQYTTCTVKFNAGVSKDKIIIKRYIPKGIAKREGKNHFFKSKFFLF